MQLLQDSALKMVKTTIAQRANASSVTINALSLAACEHEIAHSMSAGYRCAEVWKKRKINQSQKRQHGVKIGLVSAKGFATAAGFIIIPVLILCFLYLRNCLYVRA